MEQTLPCVREEREFWAERSAKTRQMGWSGEQAGEGEVQTAGRQAAEPANSLRGWGFIPVTTGKFAGKQQQEPNRNRRSRTSVDGSLAEGEAGGPGMRESYPRAPAAGLRGQIRNFQKKLPYFQRPSNSSFLSPCLMRVQTGFLLR